MKLIFATRPSTLARWQTQWVIHALQTLHPNLECEEKIIITQGDNILDKPLPKIGGKGLFTQELESELLNGSVHCAVHSLKDLPLDNPNGLTVGCIPIRAEVRDALISKNGYTVDTLPPNASLGTSSLRRAAQILSLRPDIRTQSLRGNVDTRLRKALDGQYDAIILAGAGLTRLGLEDHVTEWLRLDMMLPAPGQGALAVECRAADDSTIRLLAALDDSSTRKAVTAERSFLSGLGGGCAVPVAAYATVESGVLMGEAASKDQTTNILLGNRLEVKFAAIGPKTAETLKARGITPDFMPGEYIAEAILPGLGDLRGKWVLLPRAKMARQALPEAIANAGGIAHEIAVYKTLPAQPDPDSIAALKSGVNVVTLTSPSTVQNFVAIAKQNGLDPLNLPNNPLFACIGPITEQAAREGRLSNLVVAKEYTTDGLIEAIINMEAL